jgi:hypothetical protein
MTHRIVLHFITVLQQLVRTVTVMLQLIDNDGMMMMMIIIIIIIIMLVVVVMMMIVMISTRH